MSPETLEGIYAECLMCHQVYVHGEALASCVSAVVVPNFEELRKRMAEAAIVVPASASLAEICANSAVIALYRNEFRVRQITKFL